ncbi:MAG TPA: gliding motility-associated C-terminal domain-containing protein, partial [Chitinophagales bacterium]|nr:gliding motility-associated C-terminal domain-containing protein [Chitinophagales bacterium]
LICENVWSLDLIAPDGLDTYSWSTGATSTSITVNTAGTYTLEVTSTCESFTDEITITTDPFLNSDIDLGEDKVLCPPAGLSPVLLDAANEFPEYTWNTGETTSSISVDQPGTYFVYYESACRIIVDTVLVSLCTEIGVPNAFSPNGDGTNDFFTVIAPDPSVVISFQIYNRWGELLFTGGSANLSWDGRYNNQDQPIGSYVYILRYTDSGQVVTEQGNFTLVR